METVGRDIAFIFQPPWRWLPFRSAPVPNPIASLADRRSGQAGRPVLTSNVTLQAKARYPGLKFQGNLFNSVPLNKLLYNKGCLR